MAQRKRSVTRPEPEWPDPVPVKEWMMTPVATIHAEAPVREAVGLLAGPAGVVPENERALICGDLDRIPPFGGVNRRI